MSDDQKHGSSEGSPPKPTPSGAPKLDAPTTRWRQASDGVMECVDLKTGHVVERGKPSKKAQSLMRKRAIEKKLPGGLHRGQQGVPSKVDEAGLIWIRNSDGELFHVPAGFNPENLPAKKKTIWIFNPVTCDQIIEMVMAGNSVTQIGHMPGFPPATTILRWTSDYKEFGMNVEKARRLRAHAFHDKVIDVADKTSKETAIEDRLKIEAYKWVAQVGNPDAFGTRIKHAGDVNAPIGFLIDTGAPINDEDEAAIETTSTPLTSALPDQPVSVCLPDATPDSQEEDLPWTEVPDGGSP